ncbi:MAG: MFS transporter [Pseudomonadota bacterium]|jgi:nitrate/nitrite transporter NarK|nr:MFS transporter [Pseudomonadota bacterium]
MSNLRHWLIMTILCFSGGIIFMLPFLREVYYIPMQQAFGYDNVQMGVLMSVFGALSLLAYFPGGWVADRYSPRKLISGSLLTTGLGGFYFATFPGYAASIVLHAFWGASISLVFWSALIKTTRSWAPENQQGRAFGTLESGRGIAEMLSSTVFLAVFAWLGSNSTALSQVISLFALSNIVLAVSAWFVLDDDRGSSNESSLSLAGFEEVLQVIRMPVVWLIAMVVLTAYSAYWGSFYFTPYASDVFGVSVVTGGAIGVARMWLKPLASFAAGLAADHFSVSKTALFMMLVMTFCFTGFAFIPEGADHLWLMLVNVLLVCIAIFAMRGIYFALLQEGGIPQAVTGTAAGLISAIGFTPDVFMPLLGGFLLDTFPGAQGYRYLYLTVAALCGGGCLAVLAIMKQGKVLNESVPPVS